MICFRFQYSSYNFHMSDKMSLSDLCSSKVTHIVAEDNPAEELWPWLQEQGIADLGKINVVDITWFTQSMRAGRPIPVEAQHRIQVSIPLCLWYIKRYRGS